MYKVEEDNKLREYWLKKGKKELAERDITISSALQKVTDDVKNGELPEAIGLYFFSRIRAISSNVKKIDEVGEKSFLSALNVQFNKLYDRHRKENRDSLKSANYARALDSFVRTFSYPKNYNCTDMYTLSEVFGCDAVELFVSAKNLETNARIIDLSRLDKYTRKYLSKSNINVTKMIYEDREVTPHVEVAEKQSDLSVQDRALRNYRLSMGADPRIASYDISLDTALNRIKKCVDNDSIPSKVGRYYKEVLTRESKYQTQRTINDFHIKSMFDILLNDYMGMEEGLKDCSYYNKSDKAINMYTEKYAYVDRITSKMYTLNDVIDFDPIGYLLTGYTNIVRDDFGKRDYSGLNTKSKQYLEHSGIKLDELQNEK